MPCMTIQPDGRQCEGVLSGSPKHLGVEKPSRVESFLRRYRQKHPDCYVENETPRRNEPRILYRTADVMEPLREHLRQPPP